MENSVEKPEKTFSPGVTINGGRIRAIREAKKLTQLYVANVVGVTTDTISRWENNRYPTIRRDNAEKLAAALEVALAEIIRIEEAPPPSEVISPPPAKKGWRAALFVIILLLALGAGLFLFLQMAPHPAAVRKLPRFGAPGQVIPVQIMLDRKGSESTGLIIRERLPAGWRLFAASPPASAGAADGEELKWLVPAGGSQVRIHYTVRVGPDAAMNSEAVFSGSMVVRSEGFSRSQVVGGDRTVKVAGIHWADVNGDGRIDDDEIMPAYYVTEEMKGLGLDWKTIEAIWNAKGYAWDGQKKEFVVVK